MKTNEINIIYFNEIENKINEINKDILKDLNFEKLINFILNKLHEELNNKKNVNKESQKEPKEDCDKQLSYNNFSKYYFDQNDSIIQNLFFGVKEITIYYKCCGLRKYGYEIIKYISFDFNNFNNINQVKTLQNLIFEWENTSHSDTKFCNMCYTQSEVLIQNILFNNPEILIIIINKEKNKNKNQEGVLKTKINEIEKIKTKNYEYNLICCILDNYNKNGNTNFNILYKSKNNWSIINKDNLSRENENDLVNIPIFPLVLFYGRGNNIISTNDKETIFENFKYERNNSFTESNFFQNGESNLCESKQYLNISRLNNNINNNIYSNNNQNLKVNINNNDNNNNINDTDINIHTIHNNYIDNINNNYSNNNPTINYNNGNQNNNINLDNNNMDINNDLNNNSINNNTQIINNISYINNNISYNNYSENNNINNSNIMLNSNNINNLNNNTNNNRYNSSINNNIKNNNEGGENGNIITLFFEFENEKELYLDVDESLYFKDVIEQLNFKYSWVKEIKINDFIYNNNKILNNKTIKENGLIDNARIKVI